ncbi:MAG: flagellar biosynthesis protein FliQ [Acidimicrobiia bacterium]
MNDASIMEIAHSAITIGIKLAAPILLVTMGIGLLISIFQAATQVQEVTLTFVPKLIAVALVIVIGGNWMLNEMISFTHELFRMIPSLIST